MTPQPAKTNTCPANNATDELKILVMVVVASVICAGSMLFASVVNTL